MEKAPSDDVMELYELVERLDQGAGARARLATILRRIQRTTETGAGHPAAGRTRTTIAALIGPGLAEFDALPAATTAACDVAQFGPRARALCAELLTLVRPLAGMPAAAHLEAFEREVRTLLLNLPEPPG
jgi:hypothetical protein